MAFEQTIVLNNGQAITRALRLITDNCMKMIEAGKPLAVKLYEWDDNRTAAQNRAMWPILTAFSKQILWPVNGEMQYITPDDWKDILTAAFRQETARIAEGLDGGVVMLGLRTRNFKKKEFGEWMEFLNSVAVDRGVRITAQGKYEGIDG